MKKVLIANRGEIAVRIRRACERLGIECAQVSSEADLDTYAMRTGKEVISIGPPAAAQSYLNIEKLIETAKTAGCDAIHPGYGFLSENPDFADAVINAGLTFIGPSPDSIRKLGSKTGARKIVTENGVPVTPGSGDAVTDEELLRESKKVGFPVILKAVGGGGGRGMRVARNIEELKEALPRARSEAKKNFGNEAVYFERYVEQPRHVEVQIFGDNQGNVLHFGTRECSTQRRHQKLIEEAPAPFLSEKMREQIHAAAVAAAKSVKYFNAGTAEFLVKGKEFFFLEMNTRIQVEHPVTEMVTGVDLVELQLRIARGEKLPMKQSDIRFSGHAIEFRINAEDASVGFRPAVGKLQKIERPKADWIRDDYGFDSGDQITPFYDSMIGKLIVSGNSRDEAIFRSLEALKRYKIQGLPTTIPFHKWLICTRAFQETGIDIGFVEREFKPECLIEIEKLIPEAKIAGDGSARDFMLMGAKSGKPVRVSVVSEESGTFLAVPLKADGKLPDEEMCRRSNTEKGALAALEREVLAAL